MGELPNVAQGFVGPSPPDIVIGQESLSNTSHRVSFILADQVIISEIYRVQGREDKEYEQVNSQDLLNKMNHPQKYYAANLDEVKNVLRDLNPMDAVLLFIGAGDIDNLAREIVN